MSDVPDELLREILLRLPVAPLLRFRCVSKSWKALIDSQQFIKHHLNHSRKSNSNLNIILSYGQFYSADFDLLNQTNMATFKQLPYPLDTSSGLTNILASCNGLLVLKNHKDNIIILWNPSVKRFHELPFIGIDTSGMIKGIFYGFGYDVVNDDYKLIRIVPFRRRDDEEFHSKVRVFSQSKVNVYSLKSDSWRSIPDFPFDIDCIKTKEGVFGNGVLANGALHWNVTAKGISDYDNFVAAFDLGTEEYRLFPLPEFARDDATSMNVALTVLGGCLTLQCYDANEGHVDIWVMKEYGVLESWSILFTFDVCGFSFGGCFPTVPVAYSKCGRKVLLVVGEFVFRWYDLDKRSTDVTMVDKPSEYIFAIHTCLESLVLLNNGTCDFDLAAKKKQERKDMKRERRARIDEQVKTVFSP